MKNVQTFLVLDAKFNCIRQANVIKVVFNVVEIIINYFLIIFGSGVNSLGRKRTTFLINLELMHFNFLGLGFVLICASVCYNSSFFTDKNKEKSYFFF